MKESSISAVIFPLPAYLAERLLDQGKTVFVKYMSHFRTRIKPGHKILFYESGGKKELIGEGIIMSTEFLKPHEILSKYAKEFFLNKNELEKYTRKRPKRNLNKKLLVMQLSELKRFKNTISYPEGLSLAGKLIDYSQYKKIKMKQIRARVV